MFNYLFATYEAVDPPPNYKLKVEESIEIPKPSIDFISLLDLPISSVNDTLQMSSLEDNTEDNFLKYIYTNFLLLSKDPFITNLDIIRPNNPRGVFSSNLKLEFVQSLNAGFKKALQEKGLDTNYSYILTALAALETGYGRHLAGKFNYGGRKASDSEPGTYNNTREYNKSKGYYTKRSKFRDFDSIEDFCRNLIEYLQKNRYKAFETVNSSNPLGFITHIKNKGYATSPTYVSKVMGCYNDVINLVKLPLKVGLNLVSIDIEDLLKQEGITSVNGKKIHFGSKELRPLNASIGVKNSNHKKRDPYTGNAMARDISIQGGTYKDYEDLKRILINNKKVRDYLAQKGWGILDERGKLKWRTTGDHFHFGPDSGAVRTWNAWLKSSL